MRAEIALALSLGFSMPLLACRAPFEASAPSGFAAYDDSDPFRAVSPDGVVYRVRSESADAEGADLGFWGEALKRQMESAGYAVQSEGAVSAGGETGYLIELTAPQGPEDHLYLIAVFTRGDGVIIAEAAGEVTRVAERKAAILEGIEALRFR